MLEKRLWSCLHPHQFVPPLPPGCKLSIHFAPLGEGCKVISLNLLIFSSRTLPYMVIFISFEQPGIWLSTDDKVQHLVRWFPKYLGIYNIGQIVLHDIDNYLNFLKFSIGNYRNLPEYVRSVYDSLFKAKITSLCENFEKL